MGTLPLFLALLTTIQSSQELAQCSYQINVQQCIKNVIQKTATQNKKTLSYTNARLQMFHYIDTIYDKQNNKYVKCVYTQQLYKIPHKGLPDTEVLNTEHTWPQSWLKTYDHYPESRTDLHHLFPVNAQVNNKRGNKPFAECPDTPTPERPNILCQDGFEVPEEHKGVVARAMFYMSAKYNMPINNKMEETLKHWARKYPVSRIELERNTRVFQVQGNKNPFIEHPDWIFLIEDY